MAGLEDLYKEIILDHYRNPRNKGELETPPAHKAEGFNPLCGDEIVVYVDIDDDGVIQDIATGGQGCSISQSSASMMSAAVKGKSVEEALAITDGFKAMMSIHGSGLESEKADTKPDLSMGDLSALKGVVKFPVRIKCAVLSWNTLLQALGDAARPS
jgi:nitrogen fixation NifU-like protein